MDVDSKCAGYSVFSRSKMISLSAPASQRPAFITDQT